jgi:serine/threonine-protein kinase RsbT
MRAAGARPGGDSVGAGSRADGAPANQRAWIRLSIRDEWDVVIARKHARELARDAGLSESATAALATAISEIAQNVVTHAGRGDVSLRIAEDQGRRGVIAVVRDDGPGIAEPSRAMEDGYSTAGSLGLGLPSARRLVDTFDLASAAGSGTTVVLKKW